MAKLGPGEVAAKRLGGYTDYMTALPVGISIGAYGVTATHVMRWYNHTTRDWVVAYSTADGGQVGESTYVYGLDDALSTVSWHVQQAINSQGVNS